MDSVHLVAGVAVLALNLAAAAWGGALWLARRPSVGFWYVLRAAQAAVVVQVLLGGILLLLGREAADWAALRLRAGAARRLVPRRGRARRGAEREVGDLAFETLPRERQRSIALAIVRREMGIMTVSAWVIFFLALRAAGTSTLF